MKLEETIQIMQKLLSDITKDLEKGSLGNKTAVQRVRVNSILFGKISKVYRKETLDSEKQLAERIKKRK